MTIQQMIQLKNELLNNWDVLRESGEKEDREEFDKRMEKWDRLKKAEKTASETALNALEILGEKHNRKHHTRINLEHRERDLETSRERLAEAQKEHQDAEDKYNQFMRRFQ